MNTINICCEKCLTNDALDTLLYIHKHHHCFYKSVAILGYEDVIQESFKILCTELYNNDIDFTIDYLDFDLDDYHDEYGLVMSIVDGELLISIEKARCKDDNYKLFDLDYIYISDECTFELINKQGLNNLEVDVFTLEDE